MKGQRFLNAVLVLTLLSAPTWVGADIKIGYIDSEVLRERLPEFKQVQRQLERLEQQYQQEATERQSKLLKLQEDFRKQELLMSEAKKAEMQAEFDEAVASLQQFTQEKLGPNGELFRKNVELSQPIFEQVNAALETIAEEDGFDFIFDVASNGVIVYADPERYNLTEQLLEKLEEVREEQEKQQQ
ncbi:MAG: OmpH family outer membrane protein [Candidatus Latescibacterota bacterium]|nr:OmpH family outer membrane protein [Candidatus Latescibacterota bacterium]